jgi:hypothetical protein
VHKGLGFPCNKDYIITDPSGLTNELVSVSSLFSTALAYASAFPVAPSPNSPFEKPFRLCADFLWARCNEGCQRSFTARTRTGLVEAWLPAVEFGLYNMLQKSVTLMKIVTKTVTMMKTACVRCTRARGTAGRTVFGERAAIHLPRQGRDAFLLQYSRARPTGARHPVDERVRPLTRPPSSCPRARPKWQPPR